MYPFTYHRAGSMEEAAKILGRSPEAKILAGGQTLLATMKQRLAGPSDLVDLGAIRDLKGISEAVGSVRIGAMTTHAEVAGSPEVKTAIPALAELAEMIGDPAVPELRGTTCSA
jgi:carbon-monoxide dehydrogenase medium subunit